MAQTYFDILLSEQKKRPKSKRNQIIRDAACSHGAKSKTLDENEFSRSFSADEDVIVKAVPAIVKIKEPEINSLETNQNSKEKIDSQSEAKACTPEINKVPRNLSNLHRSNFKRWISNDLCSFDDTEFQGNSVDEITKSLSTSHQVNDNEIYVDTNYQNNSNAKGKFDGIITPDESTISNDTMHQTILEDWNASVPVTKCISIDLPSMSTSEYSQQNLVNQAMQTTGKGKLIKSYSVQETPLLMRSPFRKANSVNMDSYSTLSQNGCSNQNGKENTLNCNNSTVREAPQLETQNKKYERFVKSYSSINEDPIVCKQVESIDLQIENEVIEQKQKSKSLIKEANRVLNKINETDEITTNCIKKDLDELSLECAAEKYLTNTGIDFNNVVKFSKTLQDSTNMVELSKEIDEEECSEDVNHIWPNTKNRIAFYENMKH